MPDSGVNLQLTGGGRTINAVNAALQRELAASEGDAAMSAHLLQAADALLHSAVLEDLRGHRRARAATSLGQLNEKAAAALGVPNPDGDADPFATVERLADDLGGSVDAAVRHVVDEIVRLLAATDLPELGRASSPERESAAAVAMDWLGREVQADSARERVEAYFAARRHAGAGGKVRAVRQLAGGFSKTTLLVVLETGGRTEDVVIRQVQPGRDAGGLAAEYDVVRLAWQSGVPAPEPLWLEPDDNVLGGPFFVTRKVPGMNRGDVFGPRPGTEPEVASHLARALAQLHAIDPERVKRTPVPPMASRVEILARIGEQETKLRTAASSFTSRPLPLEAFVFAWLRQRARDHDVRPALQHGDPGFHNLLVHDGRVSALLDWERSLVGDPAQDLAYVRPHVERVVEWPVFLDAYCAVGGAAPSDDRLRYYAVWHDTWRYVGSFRGLARLRGDRASVLDAVTGLLHAPRFLLNAVQTAFEVNP
jgi:aminoglycoside phosphotransferase (APT) family kinase protein